MLIKSRKLELNNYKPIYIIQKCSRFPDCIFQLFKLPNMFIFSEYKANAYPCKMPRTKQNAAPEPLPVPNNIDNAAVLCFSIKGSKPYQQEIHQEYSQAEL